MLLSVFLIKYKGYKWILALLKFKGLIKNKNKKIKEKGVK